MQLRSLSLAWLIIIPLLGCGGRDGKGARDTSAGGDVAETDSGPAETVDETSQPETSQPDAETSQPETSQPDAETSQPETSQPDAETSQPETSQPDAETSQPDADVGPSDTAVGDVAIVDPPSGPMSLWAQMVDGPAGGAAEDLADSARELIVDEETSSVYVYGFGFSEDTTAKDVAMTGFVMAYDLDTATVRAKSDRIGGRNVGKETRLFNGVIATDPNDGKRYLYVSGKTNTAIGAICPPSSLKVPDTTNGDNSTNALIMKFRLGTLDVAGCLMIQSPGRGFDEIASMVGGDGYLWIAGSTTTSLVGGPHAVDGCAVDARGCNDTFVARVDPGLDVAPVFFQFGTEYFDEDLGADYDPDNDVFYISGSTEGSLCAAYPKPGLTCTDGFGTLGNNNNFDSYAAALAWNGSGFELMWVYQFGVGTGTNLDNDTSHDIARWVDDDGTTYLYESGYTPGTGGADIRLSRIELDADFEPVVSGGEVAHVIQLVGSPDGLGDNGASLVVGDERIWLATTMRGGRDHAGLCGTGNGSTDTTSPPDGSLDDSEAEGHVIGFRHADFATATAPDRDYTVLAPPGNPGQMSVNLEGLTHSHGRMWTAGATSADFSGDGSAMCGPITGQDYDDEGDGIIFSIELTSP